MCDTLAKHWKKEGRYFAKNSDRHPAEVQYFEIADGVLQFDREPTLEKYEPQLATLERALGELSNPYRALISRPSWIWGAEMGINEKGVTIGNEAVFPRSSLSFDGLLGMDILRLALHNSASADEAAHLIGELLTQWGQGGDGSFSGSLVYANSFLITDPSSIILIESAADQWRVERDLPSATISNAYSIPDFSSVHARPLMEFFSKGRIRQRTTTDLLKTALPSWQGMRDILTYNRGTVGRLDRSMRSICINASFPKPTRTTASIVVEYLEQGQVAWCCHAPMPCFHPFVPTLITPSLKKREGAFYQRAHLRLRLVEALLTGSAGMREEAARTARELDERFEGRVRPLLAQKWDKELDQAIALCIKEAESREDELAGHLALL